ncbi:hypothetical protein SAMN07250955_101321 [Arboricoccus pini]|uniref:Alpha-2-macroglobulin n=1 Tax=Arboricoccus pini TaxID=1963835 RepID=A0A212Q1F1_9PROT|nr:alpha-2-macroglobulin [Arboricoccus pini]SNB53019.1 hypothetical protein SAMN07250955_101321 [Arboricoccus pini]
MRLSRLLTLAGIALILPLQAFAFDYVDHNLQADQALPALCLTFDAALTRGNGDAYRPFVTVDPNRDHGLSVRGKDICITGLEHGASYKIGIKSGLTDADGEKLQRNVAFDVKLPDRAPLVAFGTNQDILPYSKGVILPMRSVNVGRADIELYRIGERALADQMNQYWFGEALSSDEKDILADSQGERLFSGHVDIANKVNEDVVTGLPIDRLVPNLKPGLYVMTAQPAGASPDDWDELATQWFSVSDIGLFTAQSSDGLLVAARSLQSAEAMADVQLNIVAQNNEILGSFKTDAHGLAWVPVALLRGKGGNAPKLLNATMARGDFTYVSLEGPAMDLSELDIGGRTAPGPLDAFLWTDRGIYRPGEPVQLQALLRTDRAMPTDGLPLKLRLIRPDGVESQTLTLDLKSAGGGSLTIPVPENAYTGTWRIEADAGGEKSVGTVSFVVEDFVPPRIEVKAAGPAAKPDLSEPVEVTVDANYFYGAPAANLGGQATLTVQAADQPFPNLKDFSFGLAQQHFMPQKAEPASFSTDATGKASLALTIPTLADSTQPLEAKADVDVFDVDGRAAHAQVTVPMHTADRFIGIRSGFGADLPENAEAGFEVALVDADGKPIPDSTLRYDVVRENFIYNWYRENGHWRYETNVYEERVNNGEVAIDAQGRGKVNLHVTTGRWRLDVYDASGKTASSTYFYSGWWSDASASNKPETMPVALDSNAPADTLRLHIQPSFDAHVLVLVGDSGKENAVEFDIGKNGRTVELPKTDIPAAGTYITAIAFGKTGAVLPRLPVRALGTVWVPGAAAARKLDVAVQAPEKVQPNHTLEVDMTVNGIKAGAEAYATVAAVDDAVLQMTDFATPDPAAFYLGRRALNLTLRDVYGRLIDPAGQPGNVVSGGDARALKQIGSLDVKTVKTVALFTGPIKVDQSGHAHVNLDVPDFSGRLRVMAVAWTADQFGSGDAKTEVRPPVLAELSLPRFLAPGDKARLRASITVLEAPEQDYTVKLETDGPVHFERNDVNFKDVKRDRRRFVDRMLVVDQSTGVGHIKLVATGADGSRFERQFAIAVRSPNPYVTTRQIWSIQPKQSFEVNAALSANMLPGTTEARLNVSLMPAFDVQGMLASLRRYAYGCAEQTVSRAFPELYADVLQIDGVQAQDIGGAIVRLMSLENGGGGFGYWSAYEGANVWLTAYVLDFFETAMAKGTPVPQGLLDRTVNWLSGRFATLDTTPRDLSAGSYAAFVLAPTGKLDLSRLRYFALNAIDKMPTRSAQILTAAALRQLGDNQLAERVLAAPTIPTNIYLANYGSELRDRAMELAIGTQAGLLTPNRLASLADETARGLARQNWLSTQEEGWLLRAAAVMRSPGSLDVTLDGTEHKGIQSIMVDRDAGSSKATTLRNNGDKPIFATLSLTGIPAGPGTEESNGFTIQRDYYLPNGTAVDPSKVVQNQQLVVVITGSQRDSDVDRKALVVDMLPAGFEPETTNLPTSDDGSTTNWIQDLTTPDFTGTRDDRYVAAVSLNDGNNQFKLAYLVRVVTPGTFTLPGVQVEDMNAPEIHARSAARKIEVAPAPVP